VTELVHEGRPLVVTSERDRVGQGPWSRLLASAIVGAETSPLAERGRVLAREGAVHRVSVTAGTLAGAVGEEAVTISAAPVSPRIWAAMRRYAQGKRPLEAAVDGREQSVHLEHLLTVDWDEPLVPRGRALSRACTCGEEPCAHVVALGYAIADELDRDPSLLLRFRGCNAVEPVVPVVEEPEPAAPSVPAGDPWLAGPLPPLRPLRPLPPGAVLKRLGPSGVRVGDQDLVDVLARAYATFARDSDGVAPGEAT
jgi:hypothetical protein